jgi:dTDP-glucose 4,6-dehydratase
MNPLPPLPREDLESVFHRVGQSWEKVRGKNIFLSGASGFFGSWLLETLLFAADRLGLEVKVWALTRDVDRFRERLPNLARNSAVQLVGGGVEKFAFPQEKMAYVIHSMVPDPGMPLPEMEKWFELGTRRLLELAVRERSEGFLLCSTGAVYMPQGRPLTEEDPLIPLDAPLSYGRIRRQVEDQCLAVCKNHGLLLKIARGFAFAGPRLPENAGFALTDFLRDAREGRPIRVKGTGDPVRSYLYASDMTAWLWNGFTGIPRTEVFNLGSKESIRLIDLARKISLMVGVGLSVDRIPSLSAACTNYYVPAISRMDLSIQPSGLRTLEHILESLLFSKTFRGASFS